MTNSIVTLRISIGVAFSRVSNAVYFDRQAPDRWIPGGARRQSDLRATLIHFSRSMLTGVEGGATGSALQSHNAGTPRQYRPTWSVGWMPHDFGDARNGGVPAMPEVISRKNARSTRMSSVAEVTRPRFYGNDEVHHAQSTGRRLQSFATNTGAGRTQLFHAACENGPQRRRLNPDCNRRARPMRWAASDSTSPTAS
jgi:hypothetical protein